MPEGDTLFRSARALHKVLAGKHVTAFESGYAQLVAVDDESPMAGRLVEKVESRGKWLLMYFSGDRILATHMLMNGSWHIYRTGERWQMPRKTMRIRIAVDGFEAVAFNVPVAKFYTTRTLERSEAIPKLGPDVLSGTFTVEAGVRALEERQRTHPEDEIGNVLLNQRVMAVLGNVYKSEVCFAAKVNPFRVMRTITRAEMERMVEFAERYMRANVQDGSGDGIVTYTGNRRTTNTMYEEDRLWVYKRRGQECRRCGAIIEMRKQGLGARSTYWCPGCQV